MIKRLLSTLFSKKGSSPAAEAAPPVEPPPADEALITVYDAYGRELQITRSEWREKMLLPNLEKQQDNAGEFYELIVSALNDDFAPDLIGAAQRLVEIDDLPERSHTIQGIVLMKNGLLRRAPRVQGNKPAIAARGEPSSGSVRSLGAAGLEDIRDDRGAGRPSRQPAARCPARLPGVAAENLRMSAALREAMLNTKRTQASA